MLFVCLIKCYSHYFNMTTLEKIDKRLDLFKEYLGYRAEMWILQPFGQLYMLENSGFMVMGSLPEYDRWLIENGYGGLTEL